MNTVDILRGAKALLSDPQNWAHDGALWERRDDGGMSYCIYGALGHVETGEEKPDIAVANGLAARALAAVLPGHMLGEFNDAATHEELIDAFDRAILSLAPTEALEAVSA